MFKVLPVGYTKGSRHAPVWVAAGRATLAAMQGCLAGGVRLGRLLAAMRARELATGVVALMVALVVFWAASAATHTGGHTVGPPASAPIHTRPVRLESPHNLYWGASIINSYGEAPWSTEAMTAFDRITGKAPSIISWGSGFYSAAACAGYCQFQTAQFDVVRSAGAIPLFSWGPGWAPKVDAQIASGAKDQYLLQWAEEAKAWGHPLFLRFAWEMNGSWFPWGVGADGNTAADYVAMWRHVYDVFQRVGASNVTWVWCPNVTATTTYKPLSALYPGDAYVNWTCLDGYNGGDPWVSFGELYGPTYTQITSTIAPSKPLIIGEVSSTETGGSKAAWISNMFTLLPTLFPQIRGFVWYEGSQSGPGNRSDWEVESSPAAKAAFDSGIGSSIYASNSYSSLDTSPIPPPQ
jgi:hypothetical protein